MRDHVQVAGNAAAVLELKDRESSVADPEPGSPLVAEECRGAAHQLEYLPQSGRAGDYGRTCTKSVITS